MNSNHASQPRTGGSFSSGWPELDALEESASTVIIAESNLDKLEDFQIHLADLSQRVSRRQKEIFEAVREENRRINEQVEALRRKGHVIKQYNVFGTVNIGKGVA